jgi:flavin-dependent dehydrogenase
VHVFFERGFELYLTPVGAGAMNVAQLCRRGFLSRFSGRVQAGFKDVIGAHPAFAAGFEVEDQVRVAGPFGRGCTRASRENVVLVGDAAGFFDGISGDGMSAALVSARLCAEALDRALCGVGEAALHAYDRQRRAVTQNADLLARLSLLLAGNPRVAAIAVRNLSRRPSTFARLLSVSCGSSALRSLGPRDALAMLAGL